MLNAQQVERRQAVGHIGRRDQRREECLVRLATVGAGGAPHNVSVGFRYNPAYGTIDIGGLNLSQFAAELIRRTPQRIIAWGIDSDAFSGPNARTVLVDDAR
jgi:hypothetical protein